MTGWASIRSCLEITDAHISDALESRDETRMLLEHFVAIAKPGQGAARMLLVFAKIATSACEWLDGALVVELHGGESGTNVESFAEIGGGLRERVVPKLVAPVPLSEFIEVVTRYPRLIAPLSAAETTANRLVLRAAESRRPDTVPPGFASERLQATTLRLGDLPTVGVLPVLPVVERPAVAAPAVAHPPPPVLSPAPAPPEAAPPPAPAALPLVEPLRAPAFAMPRPGGGDPLPPTAPQVLARLKLKAVAKPVEAQRWSDAELATAAATAKPLPGTEASSSAAAPEPARPARARKSKRPAAPAERARDSDATELLDLPLPTIGTRRSGTERPREAKPATKRPSKRAPAAAAPSSERPPKSTDVDDSWE